MNEQEEEFDITAWHPLFAKIPESDHHRILFLVLDELFGEYGTDRWLGEIKITDARLADSMPIAELRDFVKGEVSRRGWKLIPPGESKFLFRVEEAKGFPHGDVLTWQTSVPSLVRKTFDSEGRPFDLLEGSGAEFVFLRIPSGALAPGGGAVEARGKIEDALDAALEAARSGRVVGGALGPNGGCIDLLILNGSASLRLIESTLRHLSLPEPAKVCRFAAPGAPALV